MGSVRLGRFLLARGAGRILRSRRIGRLPYHWLPAVGGAGPRELPSGRVASVRCGSTEEVIEFPERPPPFDWMTSRIALPPAADFDVADGCVSPRTGAVWLPSGPVFGESYGPLSQFVSWGYAAHDLLAHARRLDVETAVLPVPSAGYFHVVLEALPALLRVLEGAGRRDVLIWTGAPFYVRDIASCLAPLAGGEVRAVDTVVRVPRASVAGRRPVSGHFDRNDVARLRAFARRMTGRTGEPTERLFVTRRRASRSLGNEAALARALGAHGFRTIDPGSLAFPEQVRTFAEARVVVGAHGAGLANLAWCSPGTTVVEVHRLERPNDCYARLCHLAGLGYSPVAAGAEGRADVDDILDMVHAAGV